MENKNLYWRLQIKKEISVSINYTYKWKGKTICLLKAQRRRSIIWELVNTFELAAKTLCFKTSRVDLIKIDCLCSLQLLVRKRKDKPEWNNMLIILKKDSCQEYAKSFLKSLRKIQVSQFNSNGKNY